MPTQLPARARLNQEEQQEQSYDPNAWKAFESDTPAGRILQKLYGNNSKPKINYPKLKTSNNSTANSPFIPGGGKTSDNRTKTQPSKNSKRTIPVPTFSLVKQDSPEVECTKLPLGRKKYDSIQKEVNQINKRMTGYRPPNNKTTVCEVDKERLQQKFTYSKGSVLPNELLPGSELLEKELEHFKQSTHEQEEKSYVTQLEEMFNCTAKEIEDMKSYMVQMQSFGKGKQISNMEIDIQHKVKELERINRLINQERNK